MLMRPIKAERAVHVCHCPGDMAVRMRKVLARPWVGVRVCQLLLTFFFSNLYSFSLFSTAHKRFPLKSTEVIVLLIVAGILLGLAMVWIVHTLAIKRKHFTAYKLTLAVDKKPGMKADEMKDQLIV